VRGSGRQTRSSLLCALFGLVCTLASVWIAPLLSRVSFGGVGAGGPEQTFVRDPTIQWSPESPSAWQAYVAVSESTLVSWSVAMRESRGSPIDIPPSEHLGGWPEAPLFPTSPASDIHAVPRGSVCAPEPSERERYARIDTFLHGWPFRAFAAEAWYAASPRGWHDPTPEFRWCWSIRDAIGEPMLFAGRPIPPGLLGNLAFWSVVGWASLASMRAIRSRIRARLRDRANRCVHCGQSRDPRGDPRATCPECGAARDDV